MPKIIYWDCSAASCRLFPHCCDYGALSVGINIAKPQRRFLTLFLPSLTFPSVCPLQNHHIHEHKQNTYYAVVRERCEEQATAVSMILLLISIVPFWVILWSSHFSFCPYFHAFLDIKNSAASGERFPSCIAIKKHHFHGITFVSCSFVVCHWKFLLASRVRLGGRQVVGKRRERGKNQDRSRSNRQL